jgi:hypothetical protein
MGLLMLTNSEAHRDTASTTKLAVKQPYGQSYLKQRCPGLMQLHNTLSDRFNVGANQGKGCGRTALATVKAQCFVVNAGDYASSHFGSSAVYSPFVLTCRDLYESV